ncbi:hypothetical protein TNIN_217721 [Trichonephila inaurata madagascariensis]|uniref:Uncharacterized protein n=1 Tax=Trichonephila inaurata madagascariensis TaxID=2747483 RepID=A0A8X7CJG0_9ARAC|nr:hypothetical protein TNIN_217721 [Trichonephila inaurata madagascariensis]
MNKLRLGNNKHLKDPIKLNNKSLRNDGQIADAFTKHFASKQRKSGYLKERDKDFKRYNILARVSDDSASELCNSEFTEC